MIKYKKENKCSEYVKQLALDGEIFKEVTTDMVDSIYDYYQVSNFGRIYHNYLKIIMKPGLSTSGYHFIVVSTKNGTKIVQLHRLVLIAFNDIQDRDNYQVNHKNGDKLCNYLWNLEWVTRSENIIHAYNTGLHHLGEDNVHSKIDNKTAEIICRLIEDGFENKYIAASLDISITTVQDIRCGSSFKFISKNYKFKRRPGRLFSYEDIHCICNYFETHPKKDLSIKEHCKNALIYYDYEPTEQNIDTIRKVYTRRYYIEISKQYYF